MRMLHEGTRIITVMLEDAERKIAMADQEIREGEHRHGDVQNELAHANRVATMGLLSASIAHEINEPIAAAVVNAQAALGWLKANPPDLGKVRVALDHIVEAGNRASDVMGRIRAFLKREPSRMGKVAINEAILEVMVLTRSEAARRGISVRADLAENLPPVHGDGVQLRQVILNLVMNAVEAMEATAEGIRNLAIATATKAPGSVLVSVCDSGPGLGAARQERYFEAFYTTKPNGLGVGLSICRSIIVAHGGRLWATENVPHGAIFQFSLPPYAAHARQSEH